MTIKQKLASGRFVDFMMPVVCLVMAAFCCIEGKASEMVMLSALAILLSRDK